jgi:hypothetical protein
MSEWLQRVRPLAVALWHLSLAILLAYLFILVLMTASSQAGVADRLSRLEEPQHYGAAYPVWLESQEVNAAIRLNSQRIADLDRSIAAVAVAARNASADSLTAAGPLFSLQPVLSKVPGCYFDPAKNSPMDLAIALTTVRYCLPDAKLPAGFKEHAAKIIASDNIVVLAMKWLRLQNALAALEFQRDKLEKDASNLLIKKGKQKEINDAFGEISALQRNSIMGGDRLLEFPPSITQILLAFVSGMFGSLLLTLVLIVYPKTDLKLSETGKGYAPRILLGGLISLCVFVVIGGGTAVLGTGTAFAAGEANYLAFCAIGILAGMFSDRVAAWLSERADAFFKLSAHQAAAKAEGAAERAAAEAEAAAEHRDRATAAAREGDAGS